MVEVINYEGKSQLMFANTQFPLSFFERLDVIMRGGAFEIWNWNRY